MTVLGASGAPRAARLRAGWWCVLLAGCVAAMGAALTARGAVAQDAPVKRLRLPLAQYDGTLTPYTFELAYPLMTLVYDTLLWRDADGVPQPWLARSVTRTRGGRRLTVRLRGGVRWHDGRRLTASDVAFSMRYFAERFHPRFTPELAALRRVVARGRSTVRIDLRQPSLGFEDQPLADLPILPRHRWSRLGLSALAPPGRAIGTGPYRLASADPDRGYRFRANRRYFRGRPSIERIDVPIIEQQPLTFRALRRREVDMLPVSLSQNDAQRLGRRPGVALQRGALFSGTALLLNVRRAPFSRPAARRAVASALDRARIARSVGDAVPATRGYLHPQSRWAPGAVSAPRDRVAARRLLRRVPPIRVLAPDNDAVRIEAGRQVVLALRRLGARVELVRRSRSRVGRAIGEDGSPARFTAAITTIPPLASYDPDFLRRLFGNPSVFGHLNYSGYRSRAFDVFARRVAGARTRQARLRAVARELRLLARDVPAVPLFFSRGTFAYRSARYDDWVYVKGTGMLDKRSFLPGTRPFEAGAEELDGGSDDGGALDVLRIASLGVLLVVLALAGVALLRRRRPG